ncbi:MAG: AraC family transcriptional regulator [Provencibacterium sp.]|jgi:AraC-like DNA-binding protein/mannose-6-phosphate isomerase-like protein (cupin superfamily)|nr:AraC family transcriptional regulator [Provencibacterium sp.]
MDKIRKADGFLNEYLFVLPEELLTQVEDDELFRSLQVTDIGYFPKARYHYREREEGCAAAILLYCRDGRGSLCLQGREERTLEPGQAALIPPHTPHRYGASQEEPWSVYWVHLRGALLSAYLPLLDGNFPVEIPLPLDRELVREFHRCFEILKTPYRLENYFLVCQSAALILALLASAAGQAKKQLSPKGGEAVEKCIRFMKNSLSRPLTLEQLAEVSGFSASHLNALFKQYTGHAPVEYFIRMKMQAASKELFFTRRPVKEIAVDFGVPDPFYFSRLFKRVMGVSPTAYREQGIG